MCCEFTKVICSNKRVINVEIIAFGIQRSVYELKVFMNIKSDIRFNGIMVTK